MKKNVLALSISAALCGLGMVGSAYAITDLGAVGTVGGADKLKANNDGIGHNLIVPYFTAQGKNATSFTLTNTTSIGKAVKIRFRGAENSDDILDFQVFLSPYDVWTASVSAGATAADPAVITTKDRSCTKPAFTFANATVGTYSNPQSFKTDRLSSATNVAGTREGYIEIFNMADLAVGANTVHAAVLHSAAGVPSCSTTGFTFLDTDDIGANYMAPGVGLKLPTTGLVANWIIANVETGQAFSGQAAATQAISTADGKANTGNLVYWPQMSSAIVLAAGQSIQGLTADPILGGNGAAATIAATMQDLPDMSTPYISGLAIAGAPVAANGAGSYAVNAPWAAKAQAAQLTAALAAVNVNNDFFADTTFVGATDWVFTMPTRRYNVAVKYATPAMVYSDYTKTDTAVLGTFVSPVALATANYFDATNTTLSGNVICVTGITANAYNREEGTVVLSSSTSFSPSTVAPGVKFCGEAGVWALGQSATNVAATGTAVLQSMIGGGVSQAVPISSYTEGWLAVATPGLNTKGLPVVGAAFSKAQGPGAKNYGWGAPHTVGRVTGYVY